MILIYKQNLSGFFLGVAGVGGEERIDTQRYLKGIDTVLIVSILFYTTSTQDIMLLIYHVA